MQTVRALAEAVDALTYPLGAKPLEELPRVRPAGLGEQHLAAQAGEKLGELVGVASLVEEVRAEDEIPRRVTEQRLRLAPADARDAQGDAVSLRIPSQQLDRILGPVGGEGVGAA